MLSDRELINALNHTYLALHFAAAELAARDDSKIAAEWMRFLLKSAAGTLKLWPPHEVAHFQDQVLPMVSRYIEHSSSVAQFVAEVKGEGQPDAE